MQGLLQLPTNCIHEQLWITLIPMCACACVWGCLVPTNVCMCLRQHLALGVQNSGPQGPDEEQRWCFYRRQRLEWLEHWMEMCDLTYQRNSERGRSPRYPWRTCNGELKRMPVGVCTALPPGYQPRALDIGLVRISWNVLHMWPTLLCGNIIPMILFCSNNSNFV